MSAKKSKQNAPEGPPKPRGRPDWVKGMPSPNPTGRPKGAMQAARDVAGADVETLMRTLWAIYEGKAEGFGPRERLDALKTLMAYGHGRPVESVVTVNATLDAQGPIDLTLPDELIRALAAQPLEARALPAPSSVPSRLERADNAAESLAILDDD